MGRFAVLLALAAAALALVACGSGGDGDAGGGEGGDAAAVEEAIVGSMTSDDPADCLRFNTRAGLERASGLSGEAAVRFCEETVDDERLEDPRSVEVGAIEVDGEEASAEIAVLGSSLDGQTVEVALVRGDGAWKLDRLLDFVVFDRERLLDGMRREVRAFSEGALAAGLLSCMLDEIEKLDDAELRALALRSDDTSVHRIAESCARQADSSQAL